MDYCKVALQTGQDMEGNFSMPCKYPTVETPKNCKGIDDMDPTTDCKAPKDTKQSHDNNVVCQDVSRTRHSCRG